MAAMEGLCDRVIWLRQGRIVEDGPSREVVASYLRTVGNTRYEQQWSDPTTAPGNEHVRMHAVRVRPEDGRAGDAISVATPFVIEFEYWRTDPSVRLVPSLHLYNDHGVTVFNVGPVALSPWRERPDGATLIRDVCHVPAGLLNDGLHRVSFALIRGRELVFWLDDAVAFDVRDDAAMRNSWYGKWEGVVRTASRLGYSHSRGHVTTSDVAASSRRVGHHPIFCNGRRFLGEAIESVLAQTYQAWELLLVDDGSTDAGTEIARGYAARHPEPHPLSGPFRPPQSRHERVAEQYVRVLSCSWFRVHMLSSLRSQANTCRVAGPPAT